MIPDHQYMFATSVINGSSSVVAHAQRLSLQAAHPTPMPSPSAGMAIIHEANEPQDDEACPDYDVSVSRSNSNATTAGTGSVHWSTPFDDPPGPLNIQRRPSRTTQRQERYLYTYGLLAGTTPMQFLISVEPAAGRGNRGKVNFQLNLKANGIERPIGEPISLNLTADPRKLEFVVFIFPGNASLPSGCLYSVRVWLRVNGVDHRLFGEDALWIGKDPDFNSLRDASFARLKTVDSNKQVYHGFVGKALVNFIVRWRHLGNGLYRYSLDYEANGVGDTLFEDFLLRFESDPRTITFLIYTVPLDSKPPGASHRLRVWLRSLVALSSNDPTAAYALPFNDSYIYQRIWKTDKFKIGARLDFASLSSKVIMAFPTGGPQTIMGDAPQEARSARSGSEESKSRRGLEYL